MIVPSKNSVSGRLHRSPDAFKRAPTRILEAARETLSPMRQGCSDDRSERLRPAFNVVVFGVLDSFFKDLAERRVRARLLELSRLAVLSNLRLLGLVNFGGEMAPLLLVVTTAGVQGFSDPGGALQLGSSLALLSTVCFSALCSLFSRRRLSDSSALSVLLAFFSQPSC